MKQNIKKIYGVIGFPLIHSFSATFFNRKFQAENTDAEYRNFELPDIEALPGILTGESRLAGLNVTIPYKEQVIQFLDDLDPLAARAGAVNVIKILPGKGGKVSPLFRLVGYNSDVMGFTDSMRPLLKEGHRRALVLGTGGASKAVCVGLDMLGVEATLVSRTKRRGVLTYGDLTPEVMADHTVIVNTTPLGMYPNVDTAPDIPYDLITPQHLCYDLLYNPDVTTFMRYSQAHGATVKNGLEMLLLQAFRSGDIWPQ